MDWLCGSRGQPLNGRRKAREQLRVLRGTVKNRPMCCYMHRTNLSFCRSLERSAPSARVGYNGCNYASTLAKPTRKSDLCAFDPRVHSVVTSALRNFSNTISFSAVSNSWLCST